MSKPRWSWQWLSLKCWNLGGRKRDKANPRKHRPLRMETLNPRHLLAMDLFVGPLAPIPDSIDPQAGIPPAFTDEAEPAASQTESATGEGEAAAAQHASLEAIRYDVNGDGVVSPIDVLLLINHAQDATSNGGTVEEVSMLDVNGDGQASDHDIWQLIGYVEQQNEIDLHFDAADLAVLVGV